MVHTFVSIYLYHYMHYLMFDIGREIKFLIISDFLASSEFLVQCAFKVKYIYKHLFHKGTILLIFPTEIGSNIVRSLTCDSR